MSPLNAFTVDVEDYFQVSGFERQISREQWNEFPSRVAASTRAILNLLDRRNVRGTFFTTGDAASRFPAVVQELLDDGHELGCHGMTHRAFPDLSRDEARAEIEDSAAILRCFAPVTSFRSPYLRFPEEYVDLVADAGFDQRTQLAR